MTPGIKKEKYTDLARFYETVKQFDQAEKNYEEAIVSAPRSATPLMNMSEYFVRRNDKDKALAYIEKAVDKKKDNPFIKTGLAKVYFQFNMMEQAEETVDNVLKRYSNYSDAINLKGRILMAKNDFDHALVQFEKVIKLDPRNSKAYYYKGLCLKQHAGRDRPGEQLRRTTVGLNNDRQLSKEQMRNALSLDPGLLEPRLELVEIYIQEKDLAQARKHLEKALNLFPRSVKALTLLAGIYILDNDLKNAEKICHVILKNNPDYVPGHIRLGLVYKAMGKDKSALASFEKALELSPSQTGVLNYIVSIYMDKKEYDSALKSLNKHRSSVNKDGRAVIENITGQIYLRKNDPQKALDHFTKAIELNPSLLQAQMSLAGIYRHNNNS